MGDRTLLIVNVVGQDLLDLVEPIFEELGINKVNRVNPHMLGNFKVFKFMLAVEAENTIIFRRELMNRLLSHSDLLPMFEGGDWMKIYIFKRSAFKTRRIIEDL